MSDTIKFKIDGVEVEGEPGQTIMQAADAAGIYIPRLCAHKDLLPFGSCRVCTVMCNGRPQSACTQPIAEGMIVENETEQINNIRRNIVEMLFVEGNHFCPFCEKSGSCELQALGYRLGMLAPKYPYMFPEDKTIDFSHDDIYIDRNRCVLCARCVRASKTMDGKNVFQFVERGAEKRIEVNGEALAETDAAVTDKAMEICPVGALMKKRVGYVVPVGKRKYDKEPIGSEIEHKAN